uniref:Secreted protein n=1 Tax=Photinus pyralis TaxID=7054 RepID=A0A1Y1N0I7_PHOPY
MFRTGLVVATRPVVIVFSILLEVEAASGEDDAVDTAGAEDLGVSRGVEEDTGVTLEEEDSETVSCLVEDVPEGVDSGAWEVVEGLAGVGLGEVELVGLTGGIMDGEGVDGSGVLAGEGTEE